MSQKREKSRRLCHWGPSLAQIDTSASRTIDEPLIQKVSKPSNLLMSSSSRLWMHQETQARATASTGAAPSASQVANICKMDSYFALLPTDVARLTTQYLDLHKIFLFKQEVEVFSALGLFHLIFTGFIPGFVTEEQRRWRIACWRIEEEAQIFRWNNADPQRIPADMYHIGEPRARAVREGPHDPHGKPTAVVFNLTGPRRHWIYEGPLTNGQQHPGLLPHDDDERPVRYSDHFEPTPEPTPPTAIELPKSKRSARRAANKAKKKDWHR